MGVPQSGEMAIHCESDLIQARKLVRELTTDLGFGVTDVTRIITAASELVRNIYRFAGAGVMQWQVLEQDRRVGVELSFVDHGPGIADVEVAMQPGFTSGNGMGMGLPGIKRLMDEMELKTEVGKGTDVTVRKWLRG